MGRMQILLDDDVENKFRQSFQGLKKGDISRKIEDLIRRDLGQEVKEAGKEMKILKNFSNDFTKLILKFYNSEEFSMHAAGIVSLEWDKLRQKHGIK